jgi:hypothetical protein
MSQESATPTRRRPAGLWVLIVIILIPPVVLPLWVPLYNKTDPKLWGFPFFFWFQFALIIFSAILTATAYGLSLLADRRSGRGEAR